MARIEVECGTPAGVAWHRRHGQPACDTCKRAAARYRRQLRAGSDIGGGDRMSEVPDCDDLDLPNQHELPKMRPAPDPDWADLAACIDKPQQWWFPDHPRMTPQARVICDTCPVQPDCLEHAIRYGEDHGIWGGRSEEERHRIRRNTRRTA